MATESSSSNIIYLQFTVDTDQLMDACHKNIIKLSTNPNKPTTINSSFIFTTRSNYRKTLNETTDPLLIFASIGDHLRLYAMSEYANMDNPVLIYAIKHNTGKRILHNLTSVKIILPCIEPGEAQVLPPVINKKMDYWYLEATATCNGLECFNIKFAIYQRSRNQDNPTIFGYFSIRAIIATALLSNKIND